MPRVLSLADARAVRLELDSLLFGSPALERGPARADAGATVTASTTDGEAATSTAGPDGLFVLRLRPRPATVEPEGVGAVVDARVVVGTIVFGFFFLFTLRFVSLLDALGLGGFLNDLGLGNFLNDLGLRNLLNDLWLRDLLDNFGLWNLFDSLRNFFHVARSIT